MPTHHATSIVIGSQALLIRGASGTGKSTLARLLMDMAPQFGFVHSALVADDRVNLEVCAHKLIATAPEPIRGIMEWHGLGIVSVPAVNAATIAMIIEFIPVEDWQRMPVADASFDHIFGIALPVLRICNVDMRSVSLIFAAYTAILSGNWPMMQDRA